MLRTFWMVMVLSTVSMADSKVCIRSYPTDNTNSPCIRFPESYVFASPWKQGEEDETGICTRSYGDSYCELTPKEYRRVKTVEGESICTLNYDQPGVANLCKDLPDFYQYAQAE